MATYPKPQISWLDLFLIFLTIIILLMVFNGCTSEKHVMKGVSKGLAYYPKETIQKVRLFAPCITTGHSFSTDSAAYKNSIDSLTQTKAFYEALISGASQPTEIDHTPELDSICMEYLNEISRLNKKDDYQTQYIVRLTDDFNNVKPIIINRTDTVKDRGEVMEKDLELIAVKKEMDGIKEDLQVSEKKKNKLQGWCLKLSLSLAGLLLLIGAFAYFSFKKRSIKKLL